MFKVIILRHCQMFCLVK